MRNSKVVLIKTIKLSMVDGDRHRGRPPRRWVDDIVDWCGRPLPEVVRLTADREERRRVVSGLDGSHGPRLKKKKKKVVCIFGHMLCHCNI